MSEEDKSKTTPQPDKEQVPDLKPEKDAKGGGGFKPSSPKPGGTTTQPVTNPGN
jgi:hypothetical protein